ncbi:MAG: GNAT family N-acetyltransferase [Anaerolineae bacterium]
MPEKVIPSEPEVRVMRAEDLEAVVEIDAQVFGRRRPAYYERKMAIALDETQQLVTSLVIEVEGKVAGFIMGEVYLGEFGLPAATATIDTIGVDPAYQGRGVGTTLFEEYASHLRKIGVQSITTRVNWNDWGLLRFFEKVGFTPARVVNLELALE